MGNDVGSQWRMTGGWNCIRPLVVAKHFKESGFNENQADAQAEAAA
jgi:hypothetical protein